MYSDVGVYSGETQIMEKSREQDTHSSSTSTRSRVAGCIPVQERVWPHIPSVEKVFSQFIPISKRMVVLFRHFENSEKKTEENRENTLKIGNICSMDATDKIRFE